MADRDSEQSVLVALRKHKRPIDLAGVPNPVPLAKDEPVAVDGEIRGDEHA